MVRGERPATLGSGWPRKSRLPLRASWTFQSAIGMIAGAAWPQPSPRHRASQCCDGGAARYVHATYPAAFIARTPMSVWTTSPTCRPSCTRPTPAASSRPDACRVFPPRQRASAWHGWSTRWAYGCSIAARAASPSPPRASCSGALPAHLDERDAARTELAQPHASPRGTLRISLPLVGDLTLPLMAEFMAAYPDIRRTGLQ